VRVGTCGFAEAQARIFRDFDLLEVQRTFYQPPAAATARRWRERAPAGFVFTLKAWQLITHEATSPTYRRLREPLPARQRAQAGGVRWNPVTRMAWERTREVAEALAAEAVVFQMPRAFVPSRSNLRRLERFFERVPRDGRRLVLEPRGEEWDDASVRRVVERLDLVHGVDPFLRAPVGRGLRYFRLHGRPAYNYRYRYSEEDLGGLQTMLSGARPNWVLFNNDHMAEDAGRFRGRVRG